MHGAIAFHPEGMSPIGFWRASQGSTSLSSDIQISYAINHEVWEVI